MPDKVREGGLMRCCLETVSGLYKGDPEGYHAGEGEQLPCQWCSSWMRFANGAWEWAPDLRGLPRPEGGSG